MSDYAQTTDFSAKDALTAGDPAKAVKGVDLDVELSAISTAIATKFDSDDLATQAEAEAATNNTKLMTPLRASQQLASLASTQAVYKTAAETVNSSTTLQDDDHLTGVTIAASGVYRVTGILVCSIKASSDLKLCLTLASAPTSISVEFAGLGASTATQTRAVQTSSGSAVALTTTSNETMVIVVDGIIVNDTDATTAKLQWAQNASVAEDTILNIGSHLVFDRIA